MRTAEAQSLQVFRQVHQFLTTHPPALPAGDVAAQLVALGAVIQRMDSQSVEQGTGRLLAISASIGRHNSHRELREQHLRQVARAVRATVPGDHPLRRAVFMPPSGSGSGRLISQALAIANAVEPHQALLVGAGLAPDFLSRLRTAAASINDVLADHAEQVARQVSSTSGIRQEISQGRRIVELLDALVRPAFQADAEQLTEWESLSRLPRRRRSLVAPVVPPPAGVPPGGIPPGSPTGGTPTGSPPPVTPITRPEMAAQPEAATSVEAHAGRERADQAGTPVAA